MILPGRLGVSRDDLGAVGDGVNDDGPYFSLIPAGTVGWCTPGKIYRIGSHVILKAGACIKGPYESISLSTDGGGSFAGFGAIVIDPSVTVTLRKASGISGCLVYPTGMTFPQASSSSWSGTAFTVAGDDVFFENSAIIGFGTGITSNNYGRGRCTLLSMDNINGIVVNNAFDVWKYTNIHMWPFATNGYTTPSNFRSGNGFVIENSDDNGLYVNCFVYGYAQGYVCTASESVQYTNCSADGGLLSGANVGFIASGAITNAPSYVNCNAGGWVYGFYVQISGGSSIANLSICGSTMWNNSSYGIAVDGSSTCHLTVSGGTIQNSTLTGITVASTHCKVAISGITILQSGSGTAISLSGGGVVAATETGGQAITGATNTYN